MARLIGLMNSDKTRLEPNNQSTNLAEAGFFFFWMRRKGKVKD